MNTVELASVDIIAVRMKAIEFEERLLITPIKEELRTKILDQFKEVCVDVSPDQFQEVLFYFDRQVQVIENFFKKECLLKNRVSV